MKPRLLVLTSTYPRWANDTEPGFVHELSKRLVDEFDVTVLAPHAPGAKKREIMEGVDVRRFRYAPDRFEQLAYEGGISERIRHRRWRVMLVPLFLLCQLWSTWWLIKKLKPDAIHAHWIFPQGFLAAVAGMLNRKSTPILCTVHGADWYRLRGRLWAGVKRFTLKRSAAIAPVSVTLQRDIENSGWVSSKLSEPMPMGIHVPESVPPLKERDPRTLFFVGRLVPKKGLDVLLDAMVLLQAEFPGISLKVAGGGEDVSRYERKINTTGLAGNVSLLGPISHAAVYEQLLQAAVCVVPSLEADDGDQEGLGLVLLEALACGCMVVASDIPVFKGVLKSPEESLLLFPAGESKALADTIQAGIQTIDNIGNNVLDGNAGNSTVNTYSWPNAASRYTKFFRNQLAQ